MYTVWENTGTSMLECHIRWDACSLMSLQKLFPMFKKKITRSSPFFTIIYALLFHCCHWLLKFVLNLTNGLNVGMHVYKTLCRMSNLTLWHRKKVRRRKQRQSVNKTSTHLLGNRYHKSICNFTTSEKKPLPSSPSVSNFSNVLFRFLLPLLPIVSTDFTHGNN